MSPPSFIVLARHADDIPADWRDRLAQRLGQRPRRLGTWTELALYGALRCADASAAPPDAATRLRVTSTRATATATRQALTQACEGFPLPFTFMQSQTSHMLAALAAHLTWTGDASFIAAGGVEQTFAHCCAEAAGSPLLFGVVEEGDPLVSQWVWLAPAQPGADTHAHSFAHALTGPSPLAPTR
ncbi:MAG: hypothetical protein QM639_18360 [Rhodocyclaceae bacterium]